MLHRPRHARIRAGHADVPAPALLYRPRHARKRKLKIILPIAVLIVGTLGYDLGQMSGLRGSNTDASQVQPTGIPGNWNLVLDSEFTGNSLPAGWAPYWFKNDVIQNNTLMESSNVSVSGGYLNLAVSRSSGSLVSTNPSGGGDFQFTYGAFEARIYLPGTGDTVYNWPAFWADGQSWPTDGEIDVMEGLQGGTGCHFHYTGGGPSGGCPNIGPGWHTFGANWEPGSITFYYDGVAVGKITSGVTSEPMYLILENSISPNASVDVPSTMQVQYVRVWQEGSGSTTTPPPTDTTTTTTTQPTGSTGGSGGSGNGGSGNGSGGSGSPVGERQFGGGTGSCVRYCRGTRLVKKPTHSQIATRTLK